MIGRWSLSIVYTLMISFLAVSSDMVAIESNLKHGTGVKRLVDSESPKLIRKRNTFDEYGNFDLYYKPSTKTSNVWFQFTSPSPVVGTSTVEKTKRDQTQGLDRHLIYETVKSLASHSHFDSATGDSFSINYVGCYASWEKQYTILQEPGSGSSAEKYDDNQLSTTCARKCRQRGEQMQMIFIKGAECQCAATHEFKSMLIHNWHCNIPCPVKDYLSSTSSNHEIKEPCGGNTAYSVYCISGTENCYDVLRKAEEERIELIKSPTTLEVSRNRRKHVPVLYQTCTKCSSNHCARHYLFPNFDYFPANSPEQCVEFCSSRVPFVNLRDLDDHPDEFEREPTRFALLLWWRPSGLDLPICSCVDESFLPKLEEADPINCSMTCPGEPNFKCGGTEDNAHYSYITVYCIDDLGHKHCTGLDRTTSRHPTRSTTTEKSAPPDDLCMDEEQECDEEPWPTPDSETTPVTTTTLDLETSPGAGITVPTDGPTEPPTDGPTEPPTDGPTEPPTGGPTDSPTEPPTDGPTEPPTGGPTDSPTEPPTDGPTEPPTDAPTTTVNVTETTSSTSPLPPTTSTTSSSRPTLSTTLKPCDLKCRANDVRDYTWTVCAGEQAIVPCKDLHKNSNATGLAFWECSKTGEFTTPQPNVSNCTSLWLEEKHEEIKNINNIGDADKFVKNLAEACRDATAQNSTSKFYGHEIHNITSLVDTVVTKAREFLTESATFPEVEKVIDKAVDLNTFLITFHEPWKDLTLPEKSVISTDIIENTEEALFHLTHGAPEDNYTKNYSLDQTETNGFLIFAESFDNVVSKPNRNYEFPPKMKRDSHDSFIKLPVGWGKLVPNKQIEIAAMSIDSEYIISIMPGQYDSLVSSSTLDDDGSGSKLINGRLMSLTVMTPADVPRMEIQHGCSDIKRPVISFTGKGVEITFNHDIEAWGKDIQNVPRNLHDGELPKAVLGTSACVYWDVKNYSWSSKGCKILKANRYETICECNHLTSFAILMDVHRYVGKDFGLELLTLILCPASEIALFLSIIILSSIGGLQKIRATITTNLSLCLLLGNALVLFVLDRHYFDMSDEVCMGAAMVTHYVFLCAFMWMLIEGVQLYRMVVHVFDSGRSHIKHFGIFAYGSPLIVIAITASTGYLKGDKPYGGDVYCWLEGSYVWSFMGPVALVTTANFIILFIALKTAYQVQQSKLHSTIFIMGKMRSYRTWFKGCFSLTAILGLTWAVGFFTLMKSPGGIVAAYIFTILNASQGLFIFFFNCVFNEKVRSFTQRNLSTYLPSWLSSSMSSNPGGSTYGKRPLSSMRSGDSNQQEQGRKRTSTKRGSPDKAVTAPPVYDERISLDLDPVPEATRRVPRTTRVDFAEARNTYFSNLPVPVQRTESAGTISSVDSVPTSTASDTGNMSSDTSQNTLISRVR